MKSFIFGLFLIIGVSAPGSAEAVNAKIGERCIYDAQCESRNCNEVTKRCQGGTPGYWVGKRPDGSSCTLNTDCISNRCNLSYNICEARGGGLPKGAICMGNTDCASKKCEMSTKVCR